MAFVTCAPKALRTACSPALSRRGYVEMMGAAPSKGERSSIRGMAGLAAAVVLGGAGYMYYAGGADPKSLKEAESKLAALATGDKGGEDKAKAAATAVASGSGSALSKSEFRNFKLEKVEPYNHNTSIFTFALPEGQDSGLTVASALLTRSANEGACVDGKGRPVMRPYTPTTAPSEKGKIELIVKKYKDGAMTNHIHSLTPGDELAMKGPLPKHPWKANEFEKIALVMGGSGLTPGWQILQQIAADPEDKTKATLIYSNVTEADILLRKELDELAAKRPDQFRIVYSLDKPPRGWSGEKGWLSADLLKKYLPLPGLSDKIKIFVCGPPGQVEAVCGAKKSPSDQGELKGAMADLGYQSSQVYKF